MREDIKRLLEKRSSWILHNDKDYRDLKAALEYARNGNNKEAQAELEMWLEQRKITLLGD